MSTSYVSIQKKYVYMAVGAVVIIIGSLIIFGRSGSSNATSGTTGTASKPIKFDQAIGQTAPDFTLKSSGGSDVKLADYRGKYVVLFFNEGSMCYPACWNQIKELANDSRFNSEQIKAFSIVTDTKSEWDSIMKKNPSYSNQDLLFDNDRDVSKAYNVMNLRSSMHPGAYPGHTYFIIDKEGTIRYTLDDPSMAIRNDQIAAEIGKLGK